LTILGIDFGTSNCSAYLATDMGKVEPIPLHGDTLLMPSVIFSTRREIAVRQIKVNEFKRRLKSLKAQQAHSNKEGGDNLSDAELRVSIEKAMRREAAEEADRKYWDQTFFSSASDGQAIIFGEPALTAYISDPLSGTLVRSPKSFLGSNLESLHLKHFENVISEMLRHIRAKAEAHAGFPITSAVIGRPVNYQGMAGNNQALEIMANSAKRAGFENIEFMVEPMAAAMEFEKTLVRETLVLVVDVGGGTTDCALVRLGPDLAGNAERANDILGFSGDRIGGTDFDQALAWRSFMPQLGKDSMLRLGRPVPHNLLMDAISTRDLPAQLRFRKSKHEIERWIEDSVEPCLLSRFLTLQKGQLQHRLINSAELAKIKLSEQNSCTVPLSYLEDGMQVPITMDDFEAATVGCLGKIGRIITDALSRAKQKPDLVFVTGGMASSPALRHYLNAMLDGVAPIMTGDMLGSVGKGLGEYARIKNENRG
jgi:hypothetical chaperone protein